MIIAMSGMKKHLKNVVKRLEEKLVTTAGHSLRNQTKTKLCQFKFILLYTADERK